MYNVKLNKDKIKEKYANELQEILKNQKQNDFTIDDLIGCIECKWDIERGQFQGFDSDCFMHCDENSVFYDKLCSKIVYDDKECCVREVVDNV